MVRNIIRNTALALPLALALTAACDSEDPEFEEVGTFPTDEPILEGFEDVQARGGGFSSSGVRLNTNVVNGGMINTMRFGQPTSYGAEVVWIYSDFGWVDMNTVEVVNGEIRGVAGNVQMGAPHFEGSLWLINQNGTHSVLVLEDVKTASQAGLYSPYAKSMEMLDPDRYVYEWSSADAPPSGTPLDPKNPNPQQMWDGFHTCLPGTNGEAAWAVIYDGLLVNEGTGDIATTSWDPHGYGYFACLTGSIGKASYWGYAPDNPGGGQPNLSYPEFEAAIRMVRADYCGSGGSFTKPGEAVTILDEWSINQHSASDVLNEEAVWGPDGAICLDNPRKNGLDPTVECPNGTTIPSCWSASWNGWFWVFTTTQTIWNTDPDAMFWTKNATFGG